MDVKSIIKKLFAVAEDDASTDGEIDNAMRAAMSLMAAHRIERSDLFDADGEAASAPLTFAREERYSTYNNLTAWEAWLLKFIVAYVPGTGWYKQSGQLRRNNAGMVTGENVTKITFYGPEIDARYCGELFDEAVVVIRSAARLRFGSALSRGDAAAYAEGFCMALAESQKRQQEVLSQDKKYALVCVQTGLAVQEKAKTWLSETHNIHLRSRRGATSQRHRNGNAFQQGRADGANYRPGVTKKAGYLQ